jgi:amino-acid N-acetyltransferase
VNSAVALPLIGGSASQGVEPRRNQSDTLLRQATADDARAIHELITGHLDEGRLLPRHLGEIAVHTSRFVVAVDEGEIVGCADLAPLSRAVAEIRSLVVSDDARSAGIGRRLIDAVIARARASGFERVGAFTHAPAFFVQLGFSIVPHEWLPEKISADCGTCALFRKCGQYAVMLSLARARQSSSAKAPSDTRVPLASLHG